ncbi:HAUS augmin-like complex subunit 3 [Ambystoma mexicanum]|uniref:HAUS augmin-like complex subunit 3 n=1 Tax=Ambystoma mexicanum TaxID=8296 RepID=UPI0037E70957
MSSGKTFVEKLKKLGYVNAELNGEDFDWLFETTDTKSFLEWFCGHVSQQHVVSDETMASFNALKESGKFILDEKDIDEVLKTWKAGEPRVPSEEDVELEKLEEELRSLQKIKHLTRNRRIKLQAMSSANDHMSIKLRDEEELMMKNLKASQEAVGAENVKMNNELTILMEGVKMMISFFSVSNVAFGSGAQSVLLSQLSLKNYLSQEELRTAALTAYTKKQFFDGISELIDSSNEDNFQLLELDLSNVSINDESRDVHEMRKCEMARLQLAYICARQQLVQLRGNDASLKAGLQCAEEKLLSACTKTTGKEENLEVKITSLKKELAHVTNQVKQIHSETLPNLVKENAQLLNMPIVKGDFDLQIARQDYYTSRQDLVCSQLIKQKSSFELLQLAYEIELRKHRDIHRQLEALIDDLRQSSETLQQRMEMLRDPAISQFTKPKNVIDSKDGTFHSIYQALEVRSKNQDLFKTYEGLEKVAKILMHSILLLQDRLGVSSQEQSLILSKLDADVERLRSSMYYGESCYLLSAQELTEQFQKLESQMNSLNHLFTDLLVDLKNKRKILETNRLHKMEKQLYVHFFQDADHLKDIVEQLETQANIRETSVVTPSD